MFDIDRWREIFQSIGKNKMRTFLGAFTVALGIFIFTVLYGMGNGLKSTFKSFFVDDATNVIFIYPGYTTKAYKGFKEGRLIRLKNDDIDDLRRVLGNKIEYYSARVYKNAQALYKNESGSYSVRGVHPDHQFLENSEMIEGRYINEKDIIGKTRVTVIGRLVEEDLFKKEKALGKFLELNGYYL